MREFRTKKNPHNRTNRSQRIIMKNLTTPQAIFFGLGLIAISIIISNYDFNIVGEAYADTSGLELAIERAGSDIAKALHKIAHEISMTQY